MRADRGAAGRCDPLSQHPVGGDDHHVVPVRASHPDLLHDRVVAGARSVHRVDRAVLTNRLPTLGVSLEDQHDHVVAQVSHGDRLVEPLRRACAVTPPAGRPAADHIRTVDDQHTHAARLAEPYNLLGATILAAEGMFPLHHPCGY